ncbi:MAG: zinc ribbon domain-containing protein [Acetobacteraceae bacterium]
MIDQATFEAVQAHLRARNPKVTPARVVSGPTLLNGICFCADCDGAMTLRAGKGGRYRDYTCSIKARQGATGCKGRSIPMEKLDKFVASHIEKRLLRPERLEEVLASVLDRRQQRSERRREHLRALAQRVEVADKEVRRMGSKSDLLRTLAAVSGVGTATPGVRTSVLSWRRGWDSNPRYA